jgi:hypothetical protein
MSADIDSVGTGVDIDKVDFEEDILFHPSTGAIDFVVVASELRQFADYGFHLSAFSRAKLESLKSSLASDPEPMWIEDVELPNWEENVKFVTPALLLLAPYILSEKSLKNLCYSFTEGARSYEIPTGERFKVQPKPDESNIDAQMRYLIEKCGFTFQLDDRELDLLDMCRKLRNDFAHGDWSSVRSAIDKVSFVSALNLISAIFSKIENGMPSPNTTISSDIGPLPLSS